MSKNITREEHKLLLQAAIKKVKTSINDLLVTEDLMEVCKAGEAKFVYEGIIGEKWEEKDRPEVVPVKGFVSPLAAALHTRRRWNTYGGGFIYFNRAGMVTPRKEVIREMKENGVLKSASFQGVKSINYVSAYPPEFSKEVGV